MLRRICLTIKDLLSYWTLLAPVVGKLDSAIHRINRYPAVKYYDNQPTAIQWIVIYPVDSAIHLSNNWGQAVIPVKGKFDACNPYELKG